MTFDEWFHKEYEPADLQIKQYAENKEGLHIPATVYLEDLKKAFEAGQKGKVVEHFEAYGQCRDSRRIEGDKRKMKLSGELDYRIRYDVEHDLFHAQNVFNDEYIQPTFIEYVQKLEKENAELKADNDARKFAMAMSEKVEKQLREENAELQKEIRCECTRCVYSDSPCIRSDYGVENDEDVCPNYENVFAAYTQLKEEIAVLRKEWQEQVQKATDEGYARTLQTIQLTKAKELLERLLITSCNSDVLNLLPNCSEVLRVRVEAEQFLKSDGCPDCFCEDCTKECGIKKLGLVEVEK